MPRFEGWILVWPAYTPLRFGKRPVIPDLLGSGIASGVVVKGIEPTCVARGAEGVPVHPVCKAEPDRIVFSCRVPAAKESGTSFADTFFGANLATLARR